MGTFRVEASVRNPRNPARSVTLPLLVDTGAAYTTLPREVAAALGLEPIDTRRIQLGDGKRRTLARGGDLHSSRRTGGPLVRIDRSSGRSCSARGGDAD